MMSPEFRKNKEEGNMINRLLIVFTVGCIVLCAGIALALPTVSYFKINNDAATTANTTITLTNASTEAAYYRASERQDFAGAQWYAYSTAPAFVLSPANGTKTVYFQTINSNRQVSGVMSDTIVLQSLPQNTSSGIVKDSKALSNARITDNRQITNPVDSSKLKENIKNQTENSGLSTNSNLDKDTKGAFAGLKDERGNTPPQGTFAEPSKVVSGENKAISDAVGGKQVITGARYGDTFGADRINRGTTGSVNDYRGGNQGNAKEESDADVIDRLTKAIGAAVADMVRSEGGTPSGNMINDLQEVAYAQKAGTDGYAATKNMTWSQRSDYWSAQSQSQLMGTDPKKRPQENDMGSGQWRPVTRSDVVNMLNSIKARMNKAGGGDDPRTDSTKGGGGPVAHIAGKDDGPAKERAFGQINLDAVLVINQKINPQR
jgi:hypothetical protein